jgi:hypothetical protein
MPGMTNLSRPGWMAVGSGLQQQVLRLTNGLVIAGMARTVAMLRDDETQLILPSSAV